MARDDVVSSKEQTPQDAVPEINQTLDEKKPLIVEDATM